MTQNAFFFDQSRCTDCRACAFACRDRNDCEPGSPKLLRRFAWEVGCFPETEMRYVFAACFHCEDPACLKACPQGAIAKDGETGAVLVDSELCSGCGACFEACPYGAPQFGDDAGSAPVKCNMCLDRVKKGEAPTCVAACPMRALDFGPIDEMTAKYGDVRQLEGMPCASITKPGAVFKPAEPKRKLVPYDAALVRELFAKRGESLDDLYAGADAFDEVPASTVRKDELDMKARDEELSRSDEW